MALHQYIGARYVPTFYTNSQGTAEWSSGVIYEPLTIVTYNNNSYTSKKLVPASVGNPSANPEYWVATGVYNAQVGVLTDRVDALDGRCDDIEDDITTLEKKTRYYTPEMFGATGDGTTDDSAAFQAMFDEIPTNSHIVISAQYYKIDNALVLNKQNTKIFALGKSDYNPALLSSVTGDATLKVTAPGCSFYHMQITGTEEAWLQNDSIGWEFDLDDATWLGNIDATMFDCACFRLYKGIVTRGRNLMANACMFSNCTYAIVYEQTVTVGAEQCRGMVVNNCRFHAITVAVTNNINYSGTRHNIVLQNNFADITANLFNGYTGNVVIKGNVQHADTSGAGGFITIKEGLYADDTSRDVIQDNAFYGGSNTGNGIYINGAVHVDIKHNNISNAKNHGIIATAGAVVCILGNIINHCATAAGTNAVTVGAAASGYIIGNVIINGGAISAGGATAADNYGTA